MQLEAFLRHRLLEVLSFSGQSQMGFSLSQTHSSDEISKDKLEMMITQVNSVLDSINQLKLKHLALIRESPRSVLPHLLTCPNGSN